MQWFSCARTLAGRGFFVRFQPTPNEACYKFFVYGVQFLPKGGQSMMFDRENEYQSPIAHQILTALPMVEEVTIGHNFITVMRVEEANAEAAARYFSMRFHGTSVGGPGAIGASDEEQAAAAAERSEALQQCVTDAMAEDENDNNGGAVEAPDRRRHEIHRPAPGPATPPPSPSEQDPFYQEPLFQAGGPGTFEMGGFAVAQSSPEDEQLDEAAIKQLIEAMNWSDLKLHVSALLTDHLSSGEPHVSPDAPHPHSDTQPQEGDTEVVLMIKELLATTVRPQLQDDGGDIRFVRFNAESGAMEVELLGACRTCKSSKTTLVDLIERTTRHWIPEVSTVLEVGRRASAFERFAASNAFSPVDEAAEVASIRAAALAEDEDDGDLTKVAGPGGQHKRVVFEQGTAAKMVRKVHSAAGEKATE